MKKILSIIGARPQFIKVMPMSKVFRGTFNHVLLHTGQHYDKYMSDIFFSELSIPKPKYNLNVGPLGHAEQTGMMLTKIERILKKENPELVLVYGDTNSTLAGALAAAKLGIPVAHIEAGMRSFNKKMPEEINRVVTDHVSSLFFCSSNQSKQWLISEGIKKNIFVCGDTMREIFLKNLKLAREKSRILVKLKLAKNNYHLATVHRAENTNDKRRLSSLFKALMTSKKIIVLPLHPRTKKYLTKYKLIKTVRDNQKIRLIKPVSYLDMLMLQQNADKIITDSGGIQKEAYFLKKACITLRDETEWVETVRDGWNVLTGANSEKITQAINSFVPKRKQTDVYGTGSAANKIVTILKKKLT